MPKKSTARPCVNLSPRKTSHLVFLHQDVAHFPVNNPKVVAIRDRHNLSLTFTDIQTEKVAADRAFVRFKAGARASPAPATATARKGRRAAAAGASRATTTAPTDGLLSITLI